MKGLINNQIIKLMETTAFSHRKGKDGLWEAISQVFEDDLLSYTEILGAFSDEDVAKSYAAYREAMYKQFLEGSLIK